MMTTTVVAYAAAVGRPTSAAMVLPMTSVLVIVAGPRGVAIRETRKGLP